MFWNVSMVRKCAGLMCLAIMSCGSPLSAETFECTGGAEEPLWSLDGNRFHIEYGARTSASEIIVTAMAPQGTMLIVR
jgi:hypothetical protein